MADFDLVLRGQLVQPERIIEDGYVGVINGKVARIGEGDAPAARERHDLRGCYILPGVIDGQTHQGSQQGQEGWDPASRAAAAGGVTCMVDMPYDEPTMVNSAVRLLEKAALVESESRVDAALYGTLAADDPAEGIREMVAAGACAFKFSTFGTDPKRFPRIPPQIMHDFFAAIAPTGLAAGVHNEDNEVVLALVEKTKAAGITGPEAHGLSRPPYSETLAIAQIYELGADTGCRAHVVHCSLGRGYDMAEMYKRAGFDVSIECCIHYLVLNEEDHVMRLGGITKINPPIRPRAGVEKLWGHLAAGHIDFVSSDHVAWSENRKTDPNMFKNSSGAPGMEAMLPLLMKGVLERGIDLRWVPRLLSENPARHFRLMPRKGRLDIGYDADIAVAEPGDFTFDATKSQTVVQWSPYHGMKLPVRVAGTWLRGRQIWDGEKVLAEKGYGRFIRPYGADDEIETKKAAQ